MPNLPSAGGNVYVDAKDNKNPVRVPNILDDQIWWDVSIHGVDALLSAWKVFESYLYGYFYWD